MVSWLAVSQRDGQATARVTRAAARATAPVLAALARLEHMADGQQRAIRGALLDELLGGHADAELAARVACCGVDFTTPFRVVLCSRPADADVLPKPNLVSGPIALVPDRAGLADLVAEVCTGATGIGRAVTTPRPSPTPCATPSSRSAARRRVTAASSPSRTSTSRRWPSPRRRPAGCSRRSTSCSTCSSRTRRCWRR